MLKRWRCNHNNSHKCHKAFNKGEHIAKQTIGSKRTKNIGYSMAVVNNKKTQIPDKAPKKSKETAEKLRFEAKTGAARNEAKARERGEKKTALKNDVKIKGMMNAVKNVASPSPTKVSYQKKTTATKTKENAIKEGLSKAFMNVVSPSSSNADTMKASYKEIYKKARKGR